MLDFAVEHTTALDMITADRRDMKLRQYELSEDDWDMARQLRNVLMVCTSNYSESSVCQCHGSS